MVEEIEVWNARCSFCWVWIVLLCRTDCEKIRKEITQQKDEEKQKALEELQRQKQNELLSAQNRIEELEQQVNN